MFSDTYSEARDRFRAATAHLQHGHLTVLEDGTGDYTIDWAWAGPERRDRAVLLTSGLHGVEGYGGSAVQLALLEQSRLGQDLPEPTLLVHALNPYGMAYWRRVNENNVDLNRNFLAPGVPYASEDATYAQVDAMLNPETPPSGLEFFWPQVGWVVLRHGYQTLKNAVVGGQHQNPRGLFYGGARLERGPELLLPFLDAQVGGCARVVHIDLHSALGKRGGTTLLLEGKAAPEQLVRARASFGPDVQGWDADNADAYEIRGGLLGELIRRLPNVRYDGFTCEFGTLPNLAVLTRLRAENRLHHHGKPTLDHPAKLGMREAFAPLDPVWQAQVLAHAPTLYASAVHMLAHD